MDAVTLKELYIKNSIDQFWCFNKNISEETNTYTFNKNKLFSYFNIDNKLLNNDWNTFLLYILGEAQFGELHWNINGYKKIYYYLRPYLPKILRPILHKITKNTNINKSRLNWPIEYRYIYFLYDILEEIKNKYKNIREKPFWPKDYKFAFAITHDVETESGLKFVNKIADLDESFGFVSAFNFVPKDYRINYSLFDNLRKRGFEIGVHGLKHDGKLFLSRMEFKRCAKYINDYLKEWNAVGFRSPFTHRNPLWMQDLDIEYDSSFFDTDPFETIHGGTMSIWPFFCGKFVELPYTLIQDSTLFETLNQSTPKMWFDKITFISKWGGMALINVHPDYMRDPKHYAVYKTFLKQMSEYQKDDKYHFWHTLPRDVSRWWIKRTNK